jgi:hypothetical protein
MKNKMGLTCLCAMSLIMTACGGGGGGSTTGTGGGGGNGGGGGGGNTSISVSIAPTAATVALSGTQQFSATVTPSSAQQTVTWTVAAGSGTTCSGSACGQVDTTGLYTAPNSLPAGNPPQVKVTATSTQDTTKSSSANVVLVSSQNSRVKGTYTFRFAGFNSAGEVLSVGTFTTDGNGNVTSGSEVISTSSGPMPATTITGGTYSIGNDGRGDMMLNTSSGTFCYVFAVGSTTIDNPLFVQFDNTTAPIACTGTQMGVGTHGSGLMNLATTSSFNLASFNQPYVFELNGFDASGKRTAYAGRFVGDGAGNITSWSLDKNDNGAPTPTSGSTGTYTVGSNGVGTLTLNGSTPLNLNLFMKNSDEIFLSVSDPLIINASASGVAESQDPNQLYDSTTFKGVSVFYVTGVGSNTAQGRVFGGLATTDGAGNVSGSFDQNDAGVISSNVSYTGTYTAAGSGRYTISIGGVPFVMYAITVNKGFLLDQSSPAVLSGILEPQTTNPISAGTIGGTFVQTAQQVSTAAAQDTVAALSLNSSQGKISGTQDETDGTENPNQTVVGSYTVSSNGRGTFDLTSPATSTGVLYVIGQSKFIVIPVDPGNTSPQILVNGH